MSGLDRKRPFGQVFGGGPVAYAQDDKLFDQNGVECDSNGNPIQTRKPATSVDEIKNRLKGDGNVAAG